MNLNEVQANILSRYSLGRLSSIEPLGNSGGFSGAQFWKVESDAGTFCLRRWGNPPQQLAWIHQVLGAAKETIPVCCPIDTQDRRTWVESSGFIWELSPWAQGQADFNNAPSVERLKSATQSLASFHQLAQAFCSHLCQTGPSPSLMVRLEGVKQAQVAFPEFLQAVTQSPSSRLQELALALLQIIQGSLVDLHNRVDHFASMDWKLAPAICDIHHDHLFFREDELVGIIDFEAMKLDTQCLDLARMIGSLRMDNSPPWSNGIEFYCQQTPLLECEIELIPVLHLCNLVLGSINWIKWIFVQQRQFENYDRIADRLSDFLTQLTRLTQSPDSI